MPVPSNAILAKTTVEVDPDSLRVSERRQEEGRRSLDVGVERNFRRSVEIEEGLGRTIQEARLWHIKERV